VRGTEGTETETDRQTDREPHTERGREANKDSPALNLEPNGDGQVGQGWDACTARTSVSECDSGETELP
jgi:hypothetical protein